jgi:hypothetical protein
MGVRNLHVGCSSAGFEKGELGHMICQYSVSGTQVLQKVVVLHHCFLLTDVGIKLLVGCSIKVMIAAATDGLFDYFSVGVWDSGAIRIAR